MWRSYKAALIQKVAFHCFFTNKHKNKHKKKPDCFTIRAQIEDKPWALPKPTCFLKKARPKTFI